MPDIWVDVDAAVTVPVNIMALLDDSDYKTPEESIAYNESGMDLNWNFVTSAGVQTQTNVTPTTGGGDYDWSHVGNAMYKIGIPASGGISINNDTEGYGWFSGVCDGVLPWRGPTIGFRAAGLNDKLCDSAYDTTRGLAGTALPAAAANASGGLPISAGGGLALDTLLGYLTGAVATASKLRAYIQLLARKDAAIAADLATELGEINADQGSGAGAYSNQTDGQEAIRDYAAPASSALDKATWTDARAGYQDNLNIGENVAGTSEVTSIQNNTRCVRVVPAAIERPDSGSTTYRVELLLYDETGNMEAPDSAPTIELVNEAGTDRSSRLDSTTMALVETGRYRAIYTASDSDDIEQLVWSFAVVEGGSTRKYGNSTQVVDTTAVDFTAADRSKLEGVYNKLPSKSYITGTANSDGDIQADEATGSFPGSVASVAGAVASVTNPVATDTASRNASKADVSGLALEATLGTPAGASLAADIAAAKADTAAILQDTGTDGVVVAAGSKTGYALTGDYDAAKTAAQAGDAMTLTAGERTTLAGSIWNALTSGLTTVGSVGKRIVDYLTGNAYTRLGAPAGDSIADDIANIEAGGSAPTVDEIDAKITAEHGAGSYVGGITIGGSNITIEDNQ